MKVRSVLAVMQSNKFVLIRFYSGDKPLGINCGIINIQHIKENLYQNKAAHIGSMTPCNINEYITNKVPFLLVYKS